MSKVYSIHIVEPHPGVNQNDFEQLLIDAFGTSPLPGWKMTVARGDRGDGKDQYVVIQEFDSPEVRNRYFPAEGGEPAQEVQQLMANAPAELVERFKALVAVGTGMKYTDYVTLSR
jgi:hypothetical protein